MNSFSFYKSIYDRELARRVTLDSLINIPITILTIIVGLNAIKIDEIFSDKILSDYKLPHVFSLVVLISVLTSIFFLIKSYNNWFKGFAYRNLALMEKIREFETIDIPDYNEKVDNNEKLHFEIELINRIIFVTDNHISINDQRSLDLYRAKTSVIISLIFTIFQIITLTLNF